MRKEEFKRNQSLESFLRELNTDLQCADDKIHIDKLKTKPIIFVVGPLRSGTTLAMQWLANTGEIAYPTNLLSRFYGTPLVGAKIQLLLTDERYNFRNELKEQDYTIQYSSENGKTRGMLAPNEFWYFWRHFLPINGLETTSNEELFSCSGIRDFSEKLEGLTCIFDKPFALKGMICNYNIDFLKEMFPKSIYIYTDREPSANIASALEARKRQSGDVHEWYSFKIPEYADLIKINDPEKQVAGQIYYVKKAIEDSLAKIDENRKLVFQYNDFCSNPEKYYHLLAEKLKSLGCCIDSEYRGEKFFHATRNEVNETYLRYYESFFK